MQLQVVNLAERAGEAGNLFPALASPHRLMIVCPLIEGDQSVCGAASDLGLQPPLASQRLSIPRPQRIVEACRQEQSVHYRLTSGDARALAETPAAFVCVVPIAAVAN